MNANVKALLDKIPDEPPPNYKGMARLLWYIYQKKVSPSEAAKLIHVYAIAWHDAYAKKILERDDKLTGSADPKQNAVTADSTRTDALPL